MSHARVETNSFLDFNQLFHHDQLSKVIEPIFPHFERMIKSYVWFNLLFCAIGVAEAAIFISYFTVLSQSFVLAFSLAIIFFTCFSYFTLRLYLQTKKPEQLLQIKERYVEACKTLINYQEGIPEHHVALAKAYCKLANNLHAKEYAYYRPPSWLEILAPTLEKMSCWWHWQDFHAMREHLLKGAVEENIKLVKCEPTSLEAHASLANAYVMLSGLYIDPRKMEGYEGDHWISSKKFTAEMEKKFRATAERAIEEFKILSEYAPDDSWVHSQLAYSYHDLQMPEEEIREYETLHRLNHEDRDILFKLGKLYFEQGLNAKGLKVYEELKRYHYKKAESLIKLYGVYEFH